MYCRFATPFTFAIAVLLLSSIDATSQETKEERPALILSPKAGAKVGQFEDIEGKLNVKDGWPVVLVQAQVSGQQWYVQGPVEEVAQGKFTANAQFGEEKTKAGTKYRIAIVVAKDKEAAHKFEKGAMKNSLPAGLPRAEYVDVVRE